ncbi:hypothetical protein LSH36_804g00023 [Paralvinella palmiformis]|uniref:Uncharacterized protein n=1 Tax=Paralvinella palmiformis TaxID=53620 RepID=A0AAD9MS92_9ANNE|nr:hypothetical protein LSH36_804g00023 [Paralvinella palmiformis]
MLTKDDMTQISEKSPLSKQDSYWPILSQAIAISMTGLLMLKDIRLIERFNLIMVPILLGMVFVMFIWSLTRHGALNGIRFFFTPDFVTLASPNLWMDAASQNAFDCNAGWGMFIALSSAMKRDEPIVKYSLLIPIGNNIVRYIGHRFSLFCGMMMFSTAFSSLPSDLNTTSTGYIVEILKTSGPASSGLTFICSMIGILENVIQVLVNYGVSRIYSVFAVTVASFILGLGSSINLDFLTNQDFTWGYALVISGLILQVMVIQYGTSKFREHVVNGLGSHDWYVPRIWEWFVKFLGPVQVGIILLWWISDRIITAQKDQQHWYSFKPQGLLPTVLQWCGLAVVVITINVILFYVKPSWFTEHSTSNNSQLLDESADIGNIVSTEYESIRGDDKNTSNSKNSFLEMDSTTSENKVKVEDLDVDVLGGVPFTDCTDITIRTADHLVIISDGSHVQYGSNVFNSDPSIRRNQAHL